MHYAFGGGRGIGRAHSVNPCHAEACPQAARPALAPALDAAHVALVQGQPREGVPSLLSRLAQEVKRFAPATWSVLVR